MRGGGEEGRRGDGGKGGRGEGGKGEGGKGGRGEGGKEDNFIDKTPVDGPLVHELAPQFEAADEIRLVRMQ